MNFEVGSTVGDYQIAGILGAGGMGKVYKVRNVISDRIEAMKVLLPDLANEPDLADRFLREIKVQASLEHPNIAALHTAVRVENQLLMLMEFVEGTTLEQKLKAGPLPVADAVNYIQQVLSALEYAHGHGVVHRDIKPANMMLTPAGVIKLMDFGIAKVAANDRQLTAAGATVGSLCYMSPEQIRGSAVDQRSDLYSLGVSLYELVTGKRPFDGDSQYAIMAAHLEKTPVPPVQVDPKLPALLSDVIMLAVQREPETRFQSAAAFKNALGNLTADEETVLLAPPAQAPVAAPRSKRGLWMAIGAVATALAVVGVIEFGPHKGTGAAPPTTSTPAVPTIEPQAIPPPGAQVTTPAPVQATAPSTPAPSPQAEVLKPARETPPPRRQALAPASPAPAPPVIQQPVVQQPVVQQPVTPQPVEHQAPPPAAAAQPDAAVRAALQQVREQVAMLNVRANGIRGSLKRLEAAQSASGLGLNSSLQEPLDLMNGFLDEAANALNAGDAASAKSFKEKAERQIERLEKALNR